jgi:hypothetical protein
VCGRGTGVVECAASSRSGRRGALPDATADPSDCMEVLSLPVSWPCGHSAGRFNWPAISPMAQGDDGTGFQFEPAAALSGRDIPQLHDGPGTGLAHRRIFRRPDPQSRIFRRPDPQSKLGPSRDHVPDLLSGPLQTFCRDPSRQETWPRRGVAAPATENLTALGAATGGPAHRRADLQKT